MSENAKVLAVVKVNEAEALVIDRSLNFVYEEIGRDFIGRDGPFIHPLFYEKSGRMKAFDGARLAVPMADGSTRFLQNDWWAGHVDGKCSVIVGDIISLKRCYVFSGCMCIGYDDLQALRDSYTGPVYGYWDYKKLIGAF